MAQPALHAVAVAGVLTAGLLFGGLTAAAGADPGDSDGSSQDSGGSEGGGSEGGDAGSGTTDSDTRSGVDDGSAGSEGPGQDSTPESDPTPQQPEEPEEARDAGESGDTGTTGTVPWLTFEEFLAGLNLMPTPAPAPPAFRTQEEAPVADAGTGVTRGGGGSEVPVFQAPLVAVPRTVGAAGARPSPGVGASAAPAPRTGAAEPRVAWGPAPTIRGASPSRPAAAPVPASAPTGGTATSLGYPRYLRSPTVAELAVVALPGVAGLFVVTFGGGVIGYRQANSGRFVRTAGAERFLP